MDVRKIVVVVEDVEAARTALLWALHNLLRYGDFITLLHVFPCLKSRSKKKTRLLRLKGFQLALSFKEICNSNSFFNTNVEIVVAEGDEEGARIAALVREIGASALVVELHDHSFLHRMAVTHNNTNTAAEANKFNCRVFAIKQPTTLNLPSLVRTQSSSAPDTSTNMDFSQIEISAFHVPADIPRPKIRCHVCLNPSAICWKSRRSKRREVLEKPGSVLS